MHASKNMFLELIVKTMKKKLGQSYRFISNPSNGNLDDKWFKETTMSWKEQLNELVTP